MAFIEWSENMTVGDLAIDGQHKKLIEMVNQLYEAMGRGKGEQMLEPTLKSLIKYTIHHFMQEELFMKRVGYPELEQHRRAHQELTSKVQDIYAKVVAGEYFSAVSLGGFLKEWLTVHILTVDKKIAPYTKAGVA